MASPYGHTLVGLSLFNLWFSQTPSAPKKDWLVMGLVVVGASFPDLDFIPGLILGQGGRFHHGYSHSLGVVVGVSLSAGILCGLIQSGISFFKISGFVFALGLSHLLMDFFTEAPKGFPLFWPLTEAKFLSPFPIFPRVERTWSHPQLWSQGWLCLLVESFLLLPLWLISRRRTASPQ